MRGLETLIRLSQRDLDEKRRVLGELEQLRSEFERQAQRLDDELGRERAAVAVGDGQGSAPYFAAARLRQETIARSADELAAKIEAAAEAVAEAFQDVKRFEIARDLKTRRRRAEAARVEQAELDEIALGRHRRRKPG